MKKILITGATGNVGLEVLAALQKLPHSFEVRAGVRNPAKDAEKITGILPTLVPFDFTDPATFRPALTGCDLLFLLRPPQLSEVQKYFKPLIDTAKETGVQCIVFLSVQGVESSTLIPHHTIEKLIVESGIPYVFLRPAYFMQNFTTTLLPDLRLRKRIFLPAGHAKFTLIDVRDIGAAAALILTDSAKHLYKAYELTNNEKLTFGEMAAALSQALDVTIQYESPNLLRFFWAKRRENVPTMLILVMIMLHYLPRFQKEPAITDWVEKLTGTPPVSFAQFILNHRKALHP
ncbi:NmrA family NAD(P)-binding protein [Runella slithyformis]|uniref:NmrA family protein n=1 Tax=Runella slithyformis (strain ATCC 29530 / DSM 19594 / LMG 11500 / NCIMB 11436 / LSU 4) TaxID=761193 RepID=A0A7U3ZMV0_RUNSL|nr:NmrA family NAD(P)-binding protein [Runella slithyformis]AEI50127.1 NmrA family protein [Runella slithyformis DSM 19594]